MALLTGDEVVEIAIRLEESGEAFYTAAAEKANDLDVKALFQQLALQEMYHRRAFQQMDRGTVQAVLTADQWEEFQAYTGALLQQSFFDRPEDALNVAARAEDERTASVFLRAQRRRAQSRAAGRRAHYPARKAAHQAAFRDAWSRLSRSRFDFFVSSDPSNDGCQRVM
jgi:rubrerythrin